MDRSVGWTSVRCGKLMARAALLAAIVCVVAGMAGCASAGAAPREVNPSAVGGIAWMLVELGGEPVDGSMVDRAPFVQFEDGGRRLSGSGGVNRIGGPAQVGPTGVVELGPMVATRMAGSPESMDLERRFLRALERTRRLVLTGDALELFGGEGQVLARLER